MRKPIVSSWIALVPLSSFSHFWVLTDGSVDRQWVPLAMSILVFHLKTPIVSFLPFVPNKEFSTRRQSMEDAGISFFSSSIHS